MVDRQQYLCSTAIDSEGSNGRDDSGGSSGITNIEILLLLVEDEKGTVDMMGCASTGGRCHYQWEGRDQGGSWCCEHQEEEPTQERMMIGAKGERYFCSTALTQNESEVRGGDSHCITETT